ncbi:MAG: YihY/virulence factor BrkB family protein [Sphingomonas bacterium]|nr:YihY/virulence factor BrkB family protein [Sphingomonas bacterium]
MEDVHPLSPEERRKRLAQAHARWGDRLIKRLRRGPPLMVVLKRVALGVYEDGFVHAGNLAYMSLVALFPFLILAAAIARLSSGDGDQQFTVANLLSRFPPEVRDVLAQPLAEVLTGRSGSLLWFGAIVGLWSAASFIETIRDILRRAYGVKYSASFWQYRLGSMIAILAAVVLMLIAFGLTLFLTSAHQFVTAWLPFSNGLASTLGLYRIAPAVTLFVTFYILFLALTPSRYRKIECRKWPGALLVTTWWLLTVELLPRAIGLFGGYALTYGSLAGVMVALVFFFVIGLGVVAGAELNAALAEPGDVALKGEHYEGPHSDELDVEEPAPDELKPKLKTKGIGQ